MRLISIILTLTLLASHLFAQEHAAMGEQSIVIEHVTLIDMIGSKPKADMTVVITRDRISAIGKSGKTRLPKNATVIDGTGKFLIPGLWDMHAHSDWSESGRKLFLPLEIANGVTG